MDPITELQGQDEVMSEAEFRRKMELEDDHKKKKYIALFQARTILSQIGTMPERNIVRKQLKIMKKKGLKAI